MQIHIYTPSCLYVHFIFCFHQFWDFFSLQFAAILMHFLLQTPEIFRTWNGNMSSLLLLITSVSSSHFSPDPSSPSDLSPHFFSVSQSFNSLTDGERHTLPRGLNIYLNDSITSLLTQALPVPARSAFISLSVPLHLPFYPLTLLHCLCLPSFLSVSPSVSLSFNERHEEGDC